MNRFIKPFLLLLGILFSHYLIAQPKTDPLSRTFTLEELKEDFETLRYHIDSVHAGLYVYTDKSVIEDAYEKISSSLTRPMTEIEFYRTLAPLLSLIKNGHSNIYPSKAFLKATRSDVPRFPLDLHAYQDSIYVLKNLSHEKNIPVRSVILEVNGQPITELLKELKKNITRDGNNMTLPNLTASRSFKTYYGWVKGYPESFTITVRDTAGRVLTQQVNGLPLDSLGAIRKRRYGPTKPSIWSGKTPVLTLDLGKEVAVMTLKTFSKSLVQQTKQKQFYQESFAKIKEAGVQHLILDLRDNGGGDPQPTIELFSHLYEKPFTFYRSLTTVTKKIPQGKLYSDNIFLINLLTSLKLKKKGDIYEVKGVPGLKESKPSKNVFTGKVYTLTNASSFSATGEMTAILKEANRCIFIGEEAGGNPNQNTSGVMLTLNLPHTGVRATLPLVVFEMNVAFENTGRGVIPDHIVTKSVEDMIEGRDPVMTFTKKLIQSQE